MDQRDPLERQLRLFRYRVRPDTRRAVLEAFGQEAGAHDNARPHLQHRRRERHVVPLHLAVAIVVAVAGLAFLAGRSTAERPSAVAGRGDHAPGSAALDEALAWKPSVRDQL